MKNNGYTLLGVCVASGLSAALLAVIVKMYLLISTLFYEIRLERDFINDLVIADQTLEKVPGLSGKERMIFIEREGDSAALFLRTFNASGKITGKLELADNLLPDSTGISSGPGVIQASLAHKNGMSAFLFLPSADSRG